MTVAAADEDGPGLAALFDRHYPTVVRYAGRRVRPDAAADIAAEVFVVAWRRRSEIPSDSLPWLLGVARNVVANHHRSEVRLERLAERVAALAATNEPDIADALLERSAAAASFASAFGRLSDADRDVLGLFAWEQLTVPQMAVALGCSVSAATMRLHRARGRLRAALEDHRGDLR